MKMNLTTKMSALVWGLLGLLTATGAWAADADGTWTQTTSGGLWKNTANWSGGTVATGTTATANFNSVNITTDPTIVHLDAPWTINSLTFGDTVTSSAASWTLDNNSTPANVLTFGGTSRTITVNALGAGKAVLISAALNVPLTDSFFYKAGAGVLELSGINTYGNVVTVISGGTLIASGGNALNDPHPLRIGNVAGATLKLNANETIGSIRVETSGQVNGAVDVGNYTLTLSAQNSTGGGENTQLYGLTGSGGLELNGTGELNLTGGNSGFTGTVTVNSGILALSQPSAGNNQMKVTLAGTGELRPGSGIAGTSVTIGALSGTANTKISGTYGPSSGTKTLVVDQATDTTFAGTIEDGTSSRLIALTKSGVGKLSVTSPSSTYSQPTRINGGILNVSTFANVNTASSIGKGSVAGSAADLVLNGGTLQHDAANTAATDRLFSVGTSGGAIDSSAASAARSLSFTGTGDMGFNGQTGARALTLTGSNTGNNGIALRIGDNGGATTLVKNGVGSWTISALNTYSGNTVVNAGTLTVSQYGGLANNGSNKVYIAPDADGNFAGGAPTLNRTISANSSFVGYGSSITGGTAFTTASLAQGKNTNASTAATLTMRWRKNGSTPADRLIGSGGLVSDVVNLTGINLQPFTLAMKYDNDAYDSLAVSGGLYLAWLNSSAWENAVLGNHTGPAATSPVLAAWSTWASSNNISNENLSAAMGVWGVDTANNQVWAVLDHNSEFGIWAVPETSALFLSGGGGLAILWTWRRRRGRR